MMAKHNGLAEIAGQRGSGRKTPGLTASDVVRDRRRAEIEAFELVSALKSVGTAFLPCQAVAATGPTHEAALLFACVVRMVRRAHGSPCKAPRALHVPSHLESFCLNRPGRRKSLQRALQRLEGIALRSPFRIPRREVACPGCPGYAKNA